MVQDFHSIDNYFKAANIHLPLPMEDFAMYHFQQLNDDVQLSLQSYRHHYYEITLDINMGCEFRVDDYLFSNQTEFLSLIGPRRLQSVKAHETSHDSVKGYSLFFRPGLFSSHFHTQAFHKEYPFLDPAFSPGVKLDSRAISEFQQIFELLNYEYQEYGQSSSGEIGNLIRVILEKAGKRFAYHPAGISQTGREYELVKNFEQLVQEEFLKFTTVKEYARLLHVSDKHLSQTVKKLTGRNALDIIHSARLQCAKSLLLQTHMQATEISHYLNFSGPEYFFTYFRKQTGKTPVQFRQENLK
ncbi:MAG: helix-turn-helix transcriptional regulator [Bacteroidia bacterium]|jgi:AraC-like DNA-binding protein|nr:helix-turn-helix transcriptional regulator [Bacteroidia bacterium]